MKKTAVGFITAFLMLLLAVLFVACGGGTPTREVGTIPEVLPTVADAPAVIETEAPAVVETEAPAATSVPPPSADACSIVSVEEIQEITGATYDTITSQANFPNIKLCEYRGQVNVVSLLIATGAAETGRMDVIKQLAHTPIAGFQDEAIWEPVQNLLSARSGERVVEVRISRTPGHGDEAARIEQAKALALLMFSR